MAIPMSRVVAFPFSCWLPTLDPLWSGSLPMVVTLEPRSLWSWWPRPCSLGLCPWMAWWSRWPLPRWTWRCWCELCWGWWRPIKYGSMLLLSLQPLLLALWSYSWISPLFQIFSLHNAKCSSLLHCIRSSDPRIGRLLLFIYCGSLANQEEQKSQDSCRSV